ncbi:MAG TPA: PIN domain nuclease [Ignavibacteriales bacterium]|nr:PIN domain-containing protein [Candidatus Woesearchaeota archaeon]HAB52662.1 PIN domain nuclease [Ignavibacteriales bacterium]
MKLLDSTFLIDLLRNKKDAYNKLNELSNEIALFITTISIFELAIGIQLDKNVDKIKKFSELSKFLAAFEVLNLDADSAIVSGKLKGDLISQGEDIDTRDCLIAGIAINNKVDTIITKNKKHFERINGLKVEDY